MFSKKFPILIKKKKSVNKKNHAKCPHQRRVEFSGQLFVSQMISSFLLSAIFGHKFFQGYSVKQRPNILADLILV